VFNGRGNDTENAMALKVLLQCLQDLNRAYLTYTSLPDLYDLGIRYGRTRKWLTLPEMCNTKRGDCKSLAPALTAEYLKKGIKAVPVFRFKKKWDGSTLYHILVMIPECNGYEKKLYEDPSRRLGMGRIDWHPLIV